MRGHQNYKEGRNATLERFENEKSLFVDETLNPLKELTTECLKKESLNDEERQFLTDFEEILKNHDEKLDTQEKFFKKSVGMYSDKDLLLHVNDYISKIGINFLKSIEPLMEKYSNKSETNAEFLDFLNQVNVCIDQLKSPNSSIGELRTPGMK